LFFRDPKCASGNIEDSNFATNPSSEGYGFGQQSNGNQPTTLRNPALKKRYGPLKGGWRDFLVASRPRRARKERPVSPLLKLANGIMDRGERFWELGGFETGRRCLWEGSIHWIANHKN